MRNLINKFKKQSSQNPVTNPKPNSKNDLISSDPILLNQKIKGNIYCSEEVIIDTEGEITGHIHSKSCIVNGKVNGYILCAESIEVKNTAVIEGNVKAGSIEIEAGSIVNGFISIDKKVKLPAITKKMEELVSPPEKTIETIVPVDNSISVVINIPVKEADISRPAEAIPAEEFISFEEVISVKEETELKEEKTIDIIPEPEQIISEVAEKSEDKKKPTPKPANPDHSTGSWW